MGRVTYRLLLLLKDSPSVNEIEAGAPVQPMYPWIMPIRYPVKR